MSTVPSSILSLVGVATPTLLLLGRGKSGSFLTSAYVMQLLRPNASNSASSLVRYLLYAHRSISILQTLTIFLSLSPSRLTSRFGLSKFFRSNNMFTSRIDSKSVRLALSPSSGSKRRKNQRTSVRYSSLVSETAGVLRSTVSLLFCRSVFCRECREIRSLHNSLIRLGDCWELPSR